MHNRQCFTRYKLGHEDGHASILQVEAEVRSICFLRLWGRVGGGGGVGSFFFQNQVLALVDDADFLISYYNLLSLPAG